MPTKKDDKIEKLIGQWRTAIDGLKLNHPNPAVKARVEIEPLSNGCGCSGCREMNRIGQAVVMIKMDGLPDTDDPTGKSLARGNNGGSFRHSFGTTVFPGTEAAQLAVLGWWLLYLEHEALELAKGTAVSVHPHGRMGMQLECQRIIGRYGAGGGKNADLDGIRELVSVVSRSAADQLVEGEA